MVTTMKQAIRLTEKRMMRTGTLSVPKAVRRYLLRTADDYMAAKRRLIMTAAASITEPEEMA